MFIKKKNIQHPDADITENKISEETTKADSSKPIYILGNNALAIYLYAKFVDAGENVILIANKRNSLVLPKMSIKEDYNLSKNKYDIQTSFWIRQEPKLLIITSANNEINADITAISPSKIIQTPIVCFTQMQNKSHIQGLLKKDIISAFFDGYLEHDNDKINLFGRAPSIQLNTAEEEKHIEELFAKTQISINKIYDSNLSFWQNFVPFAVGSIASAANNETIFNLLKQKEKRKLIQLCCEDLCTIAQKNNVSISADDVMKKLLSIPSSYTHPLTEAINSGKYGELDFIAETINENNRKFGIKSSNISQTLRQIYNIIIV